MKKLCSKCGNPLDLGSRFCGSCGAFNPFFISGYVEKKPALLDVKLLHQANGNGKHTEEQTIITVDNPVQQNIEPLTKVLVNEHFEEAIKDRERKEAELAQQLLKAKEDTENFKKETTSLVNEVRDELQQVEEENKRLKEELEQLAKKAESQTRNLSFPKTVEKVLPEKRFLLLTATFIIIGCLGLIYLCIV